MSRFTLTSVVVLLGAVSSVLPAQEDAEPNLQKPATRLAGNSSEVEPANSLKSASLDLSKTISFSLTMGIDQKPLVDFKGIKATANKVDRAKIDELVANEFTADQQLSGVVIRVAKDVKYPEVNSLYEQVKKSLATRNIEKPIYIAVQDPRVPPKKDEIVTREFVIQNVTAGDIYERVAKVARLLKYEVRLDPARNSFIVKGSSAKMAGIQNLISALDVKPGASKTGRPIVVAQPNENPPKSNVPDISTPRIPNTTNQGLPPNPGAIPRTQPNTPTQDGPIGRYQVSVLGNNAILFDTVTGESWFLDGNEQVPMFWSKIPMRENR